MPPRNWLKSHPEYWYNICKYCIMHHTLHPSICTCICKTCGFVHTRHCNLQVHMVFHDSAGLMCVSGCYSRQTLAVCVTLLKIPRFGAWGYVTIQQWYCNTHITDNTQTHRESTVLTCLYLTAFSFKLLFYLGN